MSKSKHTPGNDWDREEREIKAQALKNTRLALAAPEMLEALQYLNAQIPEKITGQICVTIQFLTAIAHVRAAIAKATGGEG